MQTRNYPCCAMKTSKYKYEINYDQGNDYEENIKKLKFLADNLKEEIKVIFKFFLNFRLGIIL